MRRVTCVVLAACLPVPAFAQNTPARGVLPSPEEVATKNMVTVAVGGAFTPDYEGSDDYRIIPAAAIRAKVSGITFVTRGSYLYVDVIPGNAKIDFDAGPIIGLRLNSRRDIDDDIVKLLPKRKRAIEAGAFVGLSLHDLTNPYDTLTFRVDVLHDIGNAHESTTLGPILEFSTPVSRTTYVGANVGAEFVSNRFADYYFSITPADSLATGGILPPFNASGGLKNWKAGLLVNQSITGDLLHGMSIFGVGQYSRLVGDFKRSPIVSERGSANQWTGAFGLAYTW